MSIRQIGDEADLEKALQSELAIIFKHSTVCPASAVAMEEMRSFSSSDATVPVYLLDVRQQRPLSVKTATYLGVEHESPQVIIVRGGVAAWHASHYGITAAKVADALSSL